MQVEDFICWINLVLVEGECCVVDLVKFATKCSLAWSIKKRTDLFWALLLFLELTSEKYADLAFFCSSLVVYHKHFRNNCQLDWFPFSFIFAKLHFRDQVCSLKVQKVTFLTKTFCLFCCFHYILTVVHETDHLCKNQVPLAPLSAPNDISKDPPSLKENNQSEQIVKCHSDLMLWVQWPNQSVRIWQPGKRDFSGVSGDQTRAKSRVNIAPKFIRWTK